jgi:hypothetical protein
VVLGENGDVEHGGEQFEPASSQPPAPLADRGSQVERTKSIIDSLARRGTSKRARVRAGDPGPRLVLPEFDERPELQYGGVRFERAALTVRQSRQNIGLAERSVALMGDPLGALALLDVLRRLPRVELTPSAQPAGRILLDHLQERRRGVAHNRLAQGVLPLPPSLAGYLTGRHRQAMRTNVGHARNQGIRCGPVSEVSERLSIRRAWLRRRTAGGEAPPAEDEWMTDTEEDAEWWVAADGHGEPLALSKLSIDSQCALLHGLVSVSHPARWLLHTQLVETAIGAGAQLLIVHDGNALLLPSGTQYFQRLLGYRVAHITLLPF